MKHLRIYISLIILAGLISGFNPQTAYAGKKWYDNYKSGIKAMKNKQWEKAIANFKMAAQSEYEDSDKKRIGTMFIDYFPHRELGIQYFQRSRYDLAIIELEKSILTAPSAKGYHFLNKVRAAKIRVEDQNVSAPELFLEGSTAQISF